jgi:hypothetical protein
MQALPVPETVYQQIRELQKAQSSCRVRQVMEIKQLVVLIRELREAVTILEHRVEKSAEGSISRGSTRSETKPSHRDKRITPAELL